MSFSFIRQHETSASGLEVEMVPLTPNGCHLVTSKTPGDTTGGHVSVHGGTFLLGQVDGDWDRDGRGHTSVHVASSFLGTWR